ncbi:polyhydroxyalkanoate depolymerase, partial [bacterium]
MNSALVLLNLLTSVSNLESSLDRAPARKEEWKAVLAKMPEEQRPAMEYLLVHMPLSDLKALRSAKVTEAVRLAFIAQRSTRWGRSLPAEVFQDSVVPYSVATEPRQSMRAEFQKRYLPLVAKTDSPGEAALLVNGRLFKDYNVVYNTRRLRTDQSASESIAQGMATCTGLSIMLVDALRAVGVPARMAGIHSWPGRGGNHTWVEVWDKGDWHFVGAAEPDKEGLDHGWFA